MCTVTCIHRHQRRMKLGVLLYHFPVILCASNPKQCWDYRHPKPCLALYVVVGDLNSGPRVCQRKSFYILSHPPSLMLF